MKIRIAKKDIYAYLNAQIKESWQIYDEQYKRLLAGENVANIAELKAIHETFKKVKKAIFN